MKKKKMLTFVVLLVLSVLTFWVYYRIVNRDYYKLIENFASLGDKAYPIIGHLHLVLWNSPHETIRRISAEALKTPQTAKLWIFSKLVIVLNTPQDVQTVLNSPDCLEKGSPYNALAGTGSGLITASPTQWKSHRRLMSSPFTFKNVVREIPKMNRIARNLVQDMIPFCDRGEISLIDSVGYRIMDVALSVILCFDFEIDALKKCFYIIEQSLDLTGKRLLKFYTTTVELYIHKLFNIETPEFKLFSQLVDVIDPAFVAGKQKYMPDIEQDAHKIETADELRNHPDGFLERMYRMAFHARLTENEMIENIAQFLVAATDTSTTAVGNVILCLASHPEVQEKLYAELKSIMDSDELDWNKITELKYLNRVVKESLRFTPLIPLIMRKAGANIQLEDGVIPAGTDILIPIDNLHRRPSIWGPNVHKFNPDNFLPENFRKQHPCSFIPFSYGPRNCIGYKYGLVSLRIIIAHLIKNFRFTTNINMDGLLYEYGVSVKPLPGYKVSLSKRC